MCFLDSRHAKLAMCDLRDMRNPQAVVEVASSCLENMMAMEELHMPSVHCVSAIQKEVNDRMRQIMVGWLVEVHLKFKLMPETLYLAINLVDRVTERIEIRRNEYQLLGVTAMLVASKYEEIHPPIVEDFVYITDNTYTKD